MRINELKQHVGRYFAGSYRCGRIRRGDTATGRVFQINDATGYCTARIQQAHVHEACLQGGAVVSLQGIVELDAEGKIQVCGRSCVAAAAFDGPSWHLLPRAWIPNRALTAFDSLLRLLDRMETGPVQVFVNRLFADLSVSRPYLRVSASREHHHAGAGGLLIHSVECAEAAEELARRFLPYHERALGILGALVHDIAKIRILVEQGSDRRAIYGVTQEALNLEVLAPYLAHLDAEWPNGAAALREMLAPSRYSGTSNGWTPLLLTDFIRYIDRLSAGADLRATSFRQLPASKRCTRTKQGQLLARVPPHRPTAGRMEIEAVL